MPFRGPRLTIALLLSVVVVLILGAGAALTLSGSQRRTTTAAGNSTTAAGISPGAPAPGSGRRSNATAAQQVYGPSNNLTVQLLPAAQADPRASTVQQLLQSYFDAVNRHDYGAWAQVVTPALAQRQNSDRWLDAYATTVDSSIWVLSMTGDPLRVQVRFTSEQDPELAPPDLPVDCTNWKLTYLTEQRNGQLLVGSTVPDSVSRAHCP